MPPSRWWAEVSADETSPLQLPPRPQERPAHWLPGWGVEGDGVRSVHTHLTHACTLIWERQLTAWRPGQAARSPRPTYSLDRPQVLWGTWPLPHLTSSSHLLTPQLVLAWRPSGDLPKVTSFKRSKAGLNPGS